MPTTAQTIAELIDGGEWGCSHGQGGTMQSVCRQLLQLNADSMRDAELERLAGQVAFLVDSDMERAGKIWSTLVDHLRAPARRHTAH
jgi:hypothetical protein